MSFDIAKRLRNLEDGNERPEACRWCGRRLPGRRGPSGCCGPGETIDAATAKEWGVVNEVVPHEQAYARGMISGGRAVLVRAAGRGATSRAGGG